jgi:hypothetical protein
MRKMLQTSSESGSGGADAQLGTAVAADTTSDIVATGGGGPGLYPGNTFLVRLCMLYVELNAFPNVGACQQYFKD